MRVNMEILSQMVAAAAMIGLMTAFALRCEARTPAYRAARRVFWAAAALWCSSAAGLSLNLFTAAAVAVFGAPAYAALLALSRFP